MLRSVLSRYDVQFADLNFVLGRRNGCVLLLTEYGDFPQHERAIIRWR